MERLIERLQVARRALSTLQELTNKIELSVVERDAAIQRFEYTFEATWKAAQMFLSEVEGVTANSPKSAVRACWQAGLLSEENAQHALQMCETRNMTVHTYNETLALAVYRQINTYADLLDLWLRAMEKKV
jgi:nucleotidyltransferase substrate binding protein (TIGR01987 family)